MRVNVVLYIVDNREDYEKVGKRRLSEDITHKRFLPQGTNSSCTPVAGNRFPKPLTFYFYLTKKSQLYQAKVFFFYLIKNKVQIHCEKVGLSPKLYLCKDS